MSDYKYLELLAKRYTSKEAVASEIINLSAIKSLPKGTEYFFSDLHGEHEAFLHLLKSASGMINTKIDAIFDKTLPSSKRAQLAQLIYYPEETIEKRKRKDKLTDEWRSITIYQLIQVLESVSAKYTRSRVKKRMPQEFRYILDELLNVTDDINKDYYFNEIITTILETDIADSFICELCKLIQRMAIDHLHIIGDIFDRGPRPDIIIEELIKFGEVDFQWGNHDISWMGAAAGNKALIATVTRISMSYNNFDLLEDGYGINLRPLSEFADKTYAGDDCQKFWPHVLDENKYDSIGYGLVAKMHKAITIIQFKLEGQLIKAHPEYNMDHRNLLEMISFDDYTIEINGVKYELSDKNLPTVDPANPLELSEQETEVINLLAASFEHSDLFNKQINFLYNNGSMYKVFNDNLMYHGCIPMNADGEFTALRFDNAEYSGRALLDKLNERVSEAFYASDKAEKQAAVDLMWYLWAGPVSPLFGKDKMATFERYFIEDKDLRKETYNEYYKFSEEEKYVDLILEDFGIDVTKGHIINGHVPVKTKNGEIPIKSNGKLFIIDGGISKAYQSVTGIAGYTLIYDSHALRLAEHKPFDKNGDNTPSVQIVKKMPQRVNIADTDKGKILDEEIRDLKELLAAYRQGIIREISRD